MENKKNIIVTHGLQPLYVDYKGHVWASQSNKILVSNESGNLFNTCATYKKSVIDQIARSSRYFERILRSGIHYILPLKNGGFLCTARKKILKCNNRERELKNVFNISRGTRPLNLCQVPSGEIFFGEYFSNPKREKVHIYGSNDSGRSWNIAYSFDAGEIRHVHSIVYDEYREGCWVFTGDLDHECQILFTDNNFQTIKRRISGYQRVRTVSTIPTKNGLIIPTDTPSEHNFIQLLDTKSLTLKRVFKLPGSAFYVGQAGSNLLVSTAVEPSRVNTDKYAALFISQDEGNTWAELAKEKKDKLPNKLFQHGVLKLPEGKGTSSAVYAYGQALVKLDGCLIKWIL
jgi:hypothetical protein